MTGSLRFDVLAALTVWALLVPEAMAYAGIAGVSPEVKNEAPHDSSNAGECCEHEKDDSLEVDVVRIFLRTIDRDLGVPGDVVVGHRIAKPSQSEAMLTVFLPEPSRPAGNARRCAEE
jgi:hypothetical protein